jgi:hypothetical protein
MEIDMVASAKGSPMMRAMSKRAESYRSISAEVISRREEEEDLRSRKRKDRH